MVACLDRPHVWFRSSPCLILEIGFVSLVFVFVYWCRNILTFAFVPRFHHTSNIRLRFVLHVPDPAQQRD